MKFISLIFFLAAMVGTWMMTHLERPVPESVHVGIQSDLQRIIAELLAKKIPDAKNLTFDRFYTETINATRVTAHFTYGFDVAGDDGAITRTVISGTANLEKTGETTEKSTWNVTDLKLSDSALSFSEPLQITASAKAPAEVTPPSQHE